MAKDDTEEPSPICDVCLGAQGEWIYPNGGSPKTARKWVPCGPCKGTGRR